MDHKHNSRDVPATRTRGVAATREGIEILEARRISKNLSRQQLANQAQISTDTLERLVKGGKVDKDSVRMIVSVLDLEPTDIIDPNVWNRIPIAEPEKSFHKQPGIEPISVKDSEFSFFYVERPPIEENCYREIIQPSALIRIKAPQKMGKTLLLEKILDFARQQGYEEIKLDLKQADYSVLIDLKTFLHWLCSNVSDHLNLEDKVDDYWQDSLGLNTSCTRYFQKYLLANIDTPLVLAIDNFERLFIYDNIFSEFCLLLRSWYETTKQGDRMGKIWQKLRLVIVNSTEVYPTLDTNRSPFNVGLSIDLREFNLQQLEILAKQYELDGDLEEDKLRQIMQLVGGHPYLIQELLTALKNQYMSLEQLLTLAPTEEGIFSHHLRQQLACLQDDPQLESAYKTVVTSQEPIQLSPKVTFNLYSLGLINIIRNDCIPSCNLYREYFSVSLR